MPPVEDILRNLTYMRDRHFGTMKTVNNRIDLDPPEAKTVHSVPYRAFLAARWLEKTDIDNMIWRGFI